MRDETVGEDGSGLLLRSLQRASPKWISQGKKRVHEKKNRNPRLSRKRNIKATVPAPEREMCKHEKALSAESQGQGSLSSNAEEYLFDG